MPGAKLTRYDREKYLEELARLACRGYSQSVMAERLNRSKGQISKDLKIIRRRYNDSIVSSRAELVQEKLAQYKDILQEAWEEWERSKADTFRKVEELIKPFKPKRKEGDGEDADESTPLELSDEDRDRLIKVKETITTEGRLAEVAFLKVIADCLKAERDLLGLDEPKKVDSNSTVNQFNWDMLTQVPAVGDTVNARIQAILDASSPKQVEQQPLPNGLVEMPPESANGNGTTHHE